MQYIFPYWYGNPYGAPCSLRKRKGGGGSRGGGYLPKNNPLFLDILSEWITLWATLDFKIWITGVRGVKSKNSKYNWWSGEVIYLGTLFELSLNGTYQLTSAFKPAWNIFGILLMIKVKINDWLATQYKQ